MIKTDTNYIDNPVQTKLQEILFALYDLNKIGDNWWGKEHLHEQICKLELFEQELFPINVKKKKARIFATEIVTHIFTVDEDRFDVEFKKICNGKGFLTNEINSKSYQRERYLKCVETE